MTLKIIEADQPPEFQAAAVRPRFLAMWKGFSCKCPNCGEGPLFSGYLKVADRCSRCGEDLSQQRADDAPAYFTITIVGHIVIPAVFIAEVAWQFPYWLHALIWLPLTLGLTFWLMPRVKGAIIGLQWALRMHGFGGPKAEEPDSHYLERSAEP